jgi:polysaccharide biosynthesis/export protein
MKYQFKSDWKRQVTLLSFCILCTVAWAQQGPTSNSDRREDAKLASAAPAPSGMTANAKANAGDDFVIGNEDVLSISVWKEPEISRAVAVRSDGKITLPLMGELVAAGKTPSQLQTEITSGLRPYIAEPAVTVIVQEIKSKRFNILGHIQRPGAYPLNPPVTIMDAIALAGGLRDFAKSKSIYVLRAGADGKTTRLPFNYKDVIRGVHPEQNILLEPHDTIFVP